MQSNALLKPRIIDVQSMSPFHAKVVMEPFERGYGHTLDNALRRVLLSSMPGYAPTEVKITGVLHEYSALDGVQEDVVDVLLNLKGVVLKLHNRDSVMLKLAKTGEGPVTAADIEPNHDVEIINPEHLIAHLTAGGKIEMEIKVERGRGYQPATARTKPEGGRTIGSILLDASFSPVRRVSYAVESARVEQRTDLDKLVLDIETNGVVEPEQAVRYAASVLVEQLSVFADLKGTDQPSAERRDPRRESHRAFAEGRKDLPTPRVFTRRKDLQRCNIDFSLNEACSRSPCRHSSLSRSLPAAVMTTTTTARTAPLPTSASRS